MLGRYPGFSLCAPREYEWVYAANLRDCLVEVSLQDFYYLRAENVVTAQKAAYV